MVCGETSVFGVRTINTRYGKNALVLSANVGGTYIYHRATKRGALAALKKREYG
jgi:hypothetical protein